MSNKQFLRGPYRMAELKGYTKYFRFITAEYNLRWDPETHQRWAIDADLYQTYQHHEQYRAYQEDLLALLSYDGDYDALTPLDFLEKARALKQRYFPEWWEKQIAASYTWRLNFAEVRVQNWQECIRRNARYPEESGATTLHDPECWQHLLQYAPQIVLLTDERRCFLHDLLTWVLPFYRHHHIVLYVKNHESPFSVSEAFARSCLEQLKIPLSSVSFVVDTGASPGIRSVERLEAVYTPDTCLVAKGVLNYFSIFRSEFPFIFSLNNKEDLARGLLQAAYAPENPDSLKATVGYQSRPFPQNVLLTGQNFCALSLDAFLKGQNPITLSTFFQRKHQQEQSLKILRKSVRHYAGFFTMDDEGSVHRVRRPGKDTVYLQGIRYDPQDFTLTPQRFNRLRILDTIPEEDARFLTNFSYFFTDTLRQRYSSRVPPSEAIPMVDFPFDYSLERRGNQKLETIPLYRKGFFGAHKDGSLFIGYLSVQKVTFELQGKCVTIPSDAINPAMQDNFTLDPNRPISEDAPAYLFTPAYPQEQVGEGRVNIVVINDTILLTRIKHAVTIPPVGVVLSFSVQWFENRFSPAAPLDKITWDVEFRENDTLQKAELCWLYGGYTILVQEGKNQVATPWHCEQTWRQEGWFLSQSMRTQDTGIHNSDRQPRLVLGRTLHGEVVLLTLSGRTQVSCGATLTESVMYCQNLLTHDGDSVIDLVNLDGGASVFLAAIETGQQHVLNFPAPCDLNPAGVTRPNSAVLELVPKTGNS
jgi:hypothetical protein